MDRRFGFHVEQKHDATVYGGDFGRYRVHIAPNDVCEVFCTGIRVTGACWYVRFPIGKEQDGAGVHYALTEDQMAYLLKEWARKHHTTKKESHEH